MVLDVLKDWELHLDRVGIDPFCGGDECYKLSQPLISLLNEKCINVLSWVRKNGGMEHSCTYWMSANDLRLDGIITTKWNAYSNNN